MRLACTLPRRVRCGPAGFAVWKRVSRATKNWPGTGPAGQIANLSYNGGGLGLEQIFLFGAHPILFGGTGLKTASFPVSVGDLGDLIVRA